MEIKTTAKVSTQTGVKVLVYGQAGAGKTTLIKTLKNPIILSAEAGLLSIADADIPYIEIHTASDIDEAYAYVASSDYNTVVLDSISEVAEVILADEKTRTKDVRQAYGSMQDIMSGIIRTFRDLPKNVYFTAKMEKVKDDNTGKISFGPSAPGTKLPQSLPYFFDEVFALRVEKDADGNEGRWLQTTLTDQYIAKDRSGKLAPYEPADLGKIMEKING